MRERLEAVLKCPVGIKGKTNEKMDDIGAGKGIAAMCAALIER